MSLELGLSHNRENVVKFQRREVTQEYCGKNQVRRRRGKEGKLNQKFLRNINNSNFL